MPMPLDRTWFLALVCLAARAHALDPERAPSQYVVTRWGAGSLRSNAVHAMAQSRDRHLWLGTNAGLVRFDGTHFTLYSAATTPGLPAGGVSRLAARPAGALVVGTSAGTVFELEHGAAREVPIRPGKAYVTSLHAARDGSLWVGVPGRPTVRWNEGQGTTYAEMKEMFAPFAIAEDARGAVWVGTRGHGLFRIEGERVTPAPVTKDIVHAIAFDGGGGLWIGTPHGLLHVREGGLERFTTRDGLSHDNVSALLVDRAGSLWIGTRGGGLTRRSGGRFQSLTTAAGLSDDDVRSLLEDDEGNLWVGTADGLNCVADGRFVTYGRNEGLAEPAVSAVAPAADGGVWLGLESGGVVLLRAGAIVARHALPPGEAGSEAVTALRETRDGALWIVQDNGRLYRLDGGLLAERTPEGENTDRKVRALTEDDQGPVFLVSVLGLARLRGRTLVPMPPKRPAHYLRFPHAAVFDGAGSLWVGDLYGLGRLSEGRWHVLTTADGLPQNRVRWISADEDGSLWAATAGGLAHVRGGAVARVTRQEGLPEDYLRVVVDDGRGFLWVGSMGALFRLDKRELADLFAGRLARVHPIVFDASDGLRTTEGLLGNTPAFRAADGRLWFATARGVSVVDPATLTTDDAAPEVHIEGLTVDGRAPVPGAHAAEFPPGRGQVTIAYTARSLRAPQRIRFRHRLEGLDADWVEGDTGGRVQYSSLPSGRYRFSVAASNRDGLWNGRPVSVSFTLAPPFYRRPWFFFACAAGLAALATAAHRARTRRIRERFAAVLEERTRIARELHDTLAQGLAGVKLQIDTALRGLGAGPEAEPVRRRLQAGLAVVGAGLSEVRRSIWVLRAQQAGDGRGMASSFGRQLAELTAAVDVASHFEVTGEPRSLPAAMEHNLLRIAHEAVSNALQHAGAQNLFIGLRFERQALSLEVRDDGRGFDVEAVRARVRGRHFGLIGMEERTRALGGELRLTSERGTGTLLLCRVPYEQGPGRTP